MLEATRLQCTILSNIAVNIGSFLGIKYISSPNHGVPLCTKQSTHGISSKWHCMLRKGAGVGESNTSIPYPPLCINMHLYRFYVVHVLLNRTVEKMGNLRGTGAWCSMLQYLRQGFFRAQGEVECEIVSIYKYVRRGGGMFLASFLPLPFIPGRVISSFVNEILFL